MSLRKPLFEEGTSELDKDKFLKILVKYGFKNDGTKIDVTSLFKDALSFLRQNNDVAYFFLKKDTSNEELNNKLFLDKSFANLIFECRIISEVISLLNQEEINKYISDKEMRKSALEVKQKLKEKKEEERRVVEETITGLQIEQEYRQKLLDDYTSYLKARFEWYHKELDMLHAKLELLAREKEKIFERAGKLIGSELHEIKDENGNKIFGNVSIAQMEQFSERAFREFYAARETIQNERGHLLSSIDETNKKLAIVKELKRNKQESVPFSKSTQNGLTFSYLGKRDSQDLSKEEEKLDKELKKYHEDLNKLDKKERKLREQSIEKLVANLPVDSSPKTITTVVNAIENSSNYKIESERLDVCKAELEKTKEEKIEVLNSLAQECNDAENNLKDNDLLDLEGSAEMLELLALNRSVALNTKLETQTLPTEPSKKLN